MEKKNISFRPEKLFINPPPHVVPHHVSFRYRFHLIQSLADNPGSTDNELQFTATCGHGRPWSANDPKVLEVEIGVALLQTFRDTVPSEVP